MRMRLRLGAVILAFSVIFAAMSAFAEGGTIRTYLTFRITTRTQSAIVNVGEDLQIEVGVDGVSPTRYQWYFEGAPIQVNGKERVYNLVNATSADAGIYCMEAYNEDKLLVKVEVNVRVIDPMELPATGDGSLPVGYAIAALLTVCACTALIQVKRRRCA